MSEEQPSDGTIRHRRKGPLDTTVSRLQAENERLQAVAHAAWHLLDEGGEYGDVDEAIYEVHASDWQRVSDALDALEASGWDPHPEPSHFGSQERDS